MTLQSYRHKWNFVNEARKSKKIQNGNNCFAEFIWGYHNRPEKIVNLNNYRLSKLGEYIGSKRQTFDEEIERKVKAIVIFKLHPTTCFTCRQFLEKFTFKKTLRPSIILALALKDSIIVITEHLCSLINAFLN